MTYKQYTTFHLPRVFYIGIITFIGVMLLPLFALAGNSGYSEQVRSIFTFETEVEAEYWVIVNDSVMGGLSQSELILTDDGTARFQGSVSLENYGGFASVRTYPINYRLADYEGLKIRLKGDGKTYKLRLRTGRSFDGVAYQAEFDTLSDTWTTIRVPFDQFIPVYRGRRLSNVPALNQASIAQIGLMISDKQVGEFQLEVDKIEAYRWVEDDWLRIKNIY